MSNCLSVRESFTVDQIKSSDKWDSYFSVYEKFFHRFKNDPVCLLEIGIQNGGSLEAWGKYFETAKLIVGCDINLNCSRLNYGKSNTSVVIGDADDKEVFDSLVSLLKNERFNIIIDDGSHTSKDIINCFCKYFSVLDDNGVYVVEDLHCSYWGGFGGGIYHPYSSIQFFKKIIDIINFEHWGNAQSRMDLVRPFLDYYGISGFDGLEMIKSVSFFNSMCIIEKRKASECMLGQRVISGEDEVVVVGHRHLNGSLLVAPSQVGNVWSDASMESMNLISVAHNEIDRLNKLISDK